MSYFLSRSVCEQSLFYDKYAIKQKKMDEKLYQIWKTFTQFLDA